jgi:hypothetical protein
MIGAVVYDNSGWGWLWIAASGAMLVFAVGALLTASRAGLLRAPAQTEPATVPA